MNRLLILTVALILGANCASRPVSRTGNVGVSQSTPTPERPKPTSPNNDENAAKNSEEKQDVPPEFRNIDFKNSSYQTSFRKGSVRLREGSYEKEDRQGARGDTFDLMDVDYVDLNDDGRKEAVVRLGWVSCGVSCDGGSDLFYFYSIKGGTPILLSRIQTGSLGYDCGLKSFVLKNRHLALETFRACRFNGVEVKRINTDPDERGGKFLTNRYTQFEFEFNGRRFVLKSRKILPYPEEDFRGFEPTIKIGNG
jgi:hypothetical protein